MAAYTVLLMQEAGVEGGYNKSYTGKLTQKFGPLLLRRPWLNAFLFGNEVDYGLLNVCTVYGLLHIR